MRTRARVMTDAKSTICTFWFAGDYCKIKCSKFVTTFTVFRCSKFNIKISLIKYYAQNLKLRLSHPFYTKISMFLYIAVTQKNSELVKYRPHQEIEFARVSDKWYSNLALKTEANFLLSVLVVVIADVKYKCKKLLLLTYFIRLSFITMGVKYQKREKFSCLHLKETFILRK